MYLYHGKYYSWPKLITQGVRQMSDYQKGYDAGTRHEQSFHGNEVSDLKERIKELENGFVYGDATQTHLNFAILIPNPLNCRESDK